jgi:AcrR family transcriptional regulator
VMSRRPTQFRGRHRGDAAAHFSRHARAVRAQGRRGTTTQEFAELADVNEATLFRPFGTKGQLLTAMLDYYTESSQLSQSLEKARTLPAASTRPGPWLRRPEAAVRGRGCARRSPDTCPAPSSDPAELGDAFGVLAAPWTNRLA